MANIFEAALEVGAMIAVQLKGGLGNQMFQYAFGRYHAQRHSCELVFDLSFLENRACERTRRSATYELGFLRIVGRPARRDEVPTFWHNIDPRNVPLRLVHALRLSASGWRYVRQTGFGFVDRFRRLSDWSYLDGYWQSERFFSGIDEQLRRELTLHDSACINSLPIMAQFAGRTPVAIHIRRGDYVSLGDRMGVVTPEYLYAGMAYVEARIPDPIYVVFTQDMEWCRQHIQFRRPVVFVNEENASALDTVHFEIMKRCSHFIISNSTYSWWAAWLCSTSGKLVVAPRIWALDEALNPKDIIPSQWVRL